MTSYATTYGWRSTGVRRGLVTSPTEQNPVNGGQRGPTEVYGSADPITTNQKVAGSSPAERAKESPANCGVLLLSFIRFPGQDRPLTATTAWRSLSGPYPICT